MKRMEVPFPDCSRCRDPKQVAARERWGCDGPAEYPVFVTMCEVCIGNGYTDAGVCPACGGSGENTHHRCPSATLDEAGAGKRAALENVVRAYMEYDRRNVLPATGGWADQSVSFAAAVAIIDSERGRYEQLEQDKRDREMKAAQAKSKAPQNQPRRGGRR